MGIFRKSKTVEQKQGIFSTIIGMRAASFSNQDYDTMVREGYQLNPYIFTCINKLSNAVKAVPWQLFVKDSEGSVTQVHMHPLLDLLDTPNPFHSFDDILDSHVTYLTLEGNIFTEKIKDGTAKTREIYSLRPDKVDIIFNTDRTTRAIVPVSGYQYKGGRVIDYELDDIVHIKNFNPRDNDLNFGRGQATLLAATRSGDQNNESRKWNLSLLQNHAVPPGILETSGEAEALDESIVTLIKKQFREKFQGAKNAGEPIITQYATWKPLGMNSRDLDWSQGIQQSAREICEVIGVPSILIGDPAAKTFNNYKEAKKALYVDTVLPMLNKIMRAYNQFLVKPEYGKNYFFAPNLDAVDVLREERMALWDRINRATFLTENEKRVELGYGEQDGLDVYRLPVNLIDIPAGEIIQIPNLTGDNDDDADTM